MTTMQTSQPSDQPSEENPLQIRHGRRILREVSEAHRDVVATKADTAAILGILSPTGDDSPVLGILELILTNQQAISAQIARIESKVNGLETQFAAVERALR